MPYCGFGNEPSSESTSNCTQQEPGLLLQLRLLLRILHAGPLRQEPLVAPGGVKTNYEFVAVGDEHPAPLFE